MATKAEVSDDIAGKEPTARKCGQPPEAARREEGFPPITPRRNAALLVL